MKKKILSVILVIALMAASLSFAHTVYASSRELKLDVKTTIQIDGNYDLQWFYYTPRFSGTYTFRSYNIYASEAYLFVKETDPKTYQNTMVQLAFSNTDDKLEQGSRNFMLTYHLEAGTTYRYAVGWSWSHSRADGAFTVMLTNDSYDETPIDRIEISTPVELEAYMDGSWEKDANGMEYFRYNHSKIVANMTVTLYYKNGTVSSVVGKDEIDGYQLRIIDNQYEEHWYPNNSAEYTRNPFSVSLGPLIATIDVPIKITARYSVKGKVIDKNGDPVANAAISLNAQKLAVTDNNGLFSFYYGAGQYRLTISTTHSIDRTVTLVINKNDDNNHTAEPFAICNCDFVHDGIINAKDFSFINKYADEADRAALKSEFQKSIGFTAKDYK